MFCCPHNARVLTVDANTARFFAILSLCALDKRCLTDNDWPLEILKKANATRTASVWIDDVTCLCPRRSTLLQSACGCRINGSVNPMQILSKLYKKCNSSHTVTQVWILTTATIRHMALSFPLSSSTDHTHLRIKYSQLNAPFVSISDWFRKVYITDVECINCHWIVQHRWWRWRRLLFMLHMDEVQHQHQYCVIAGIVPLPFGVFGNCYRCPFLNKSIIERNFLVVGGAAGAVGESSAQSAAAGKYVIRLFFCHVLTTWTLMLDEKNDEYILLKTKTVRNVITY